MIAKLLHRSRRLKNTVSKATFPHEAARLLNPAEQVDNFFGMNQQFVRAGILLRLLRELDVDAFLETGTNTGSTAFLVAAQTKARVYTCDIDERFYRIASRNLRPFGKRVSTNLQDSRDFLQDVLSRRVAAKPLIYLDAHWRDDLPLQREIELIVKSLDEFVIIIDDFRVPGDPAFKFDVYNGKAIEWESVKEAFAAAPQKLRVFYPAYKGTQETGSRSGWIVVATDALAGDITRLVGPDLLREEKP